MKITESSVERMACLSPRDLEIACESVATRTLQLQAKIESEGLVDDEAVREVHDEYATAMLQLVSILEADARPGTISEIRDLQARVVDGAKRLFGGADKKRRGRSFFLARVSDSRMVGITGGHDGPARRRPP